jgi:hypothetical protein
MSLLVAMSITPLSPLHPARAHRADWPLISAATCAALATRC